MNVSCPQCRCRCGRGAPSHGADVGGVSPVPVQMWQGGTPSVMIGGTARESRSRQTRAECGGQRYRTCTRAVTGRTWWDRRGGSTLRVARCTLHPVRRDIEAQNVACCNLHVAHMPDVARCTSCVATEAPLQGGVMCTGPNVAHCYDHGGRPCYASSHRPGTSQSHPPVNSLDATRRRTSDSPPHASSGGGAAAR